MSSRSKYALAVSETARANNAEIDGSGELNA